jgi:hypothetical protein
MIPEARDSDRLFVKARNRHSHRLRGMQHTRIYEQSYSQTEQRLGG